MGRRVQSCDDHESALCPALRSVPARVRKGHDSHRSAILNAGVIFNRFAERSLLSALIGSSPARSSPRVLAPHALPLFLPSPGSPRDGNSWELGFPHDGLCGRRELLTNSEIPRRLFCQRKKAGSEKLGMTLKGAVTRLGRFSHPEVLILR